MAEQYKDAAARHWKDGKHLADVGRLDNADHLYGFAAECAIKHAIQLSTNGRSSGERVHINKLWHSMSLQSLQRAFLPLYGLLQTASPFADWDVSQRYEGTGFVT